MSMKDSKLIRSAGVGGMKVMSNVRCPLASSVGGFFAGS
jgi:hypothetical protein